MPFALVSQATTYAMRRGLISMFCSTGEKGVGKAGKPLHFKGSIFHRVIKVNDYKIATSIHTKLINDPL